MTVISRYLRDFVPVCATKRTTTIFALLLSLLLAAAGRAQDVTSDSVTNREAYLQAATAAGKDPVAHARLALWCEAHDLPSERQKHLALAIKYDKTYALARGLLGLVAYQGHWGAPRISRSRSEMTRRESL